MKRSASQVITSMFGFDRPDKMDEKALLKDGLRTVSRVLYAAGGLHDRHLSVAYSNGESVNQVSGRVVYLDSDVVLQPRKEFQDYDVRNDVLVGSALVGANVKLTADAQFYDTLQEEDENIKRIYQSTEFRASEMRVENEAPGLVPYLDTRSDYYVDDQLVQTLSDAVQNPETHSEVACALLNNALLHRNAGNAVDMGVYTEAVNEAVGRLERCKNSEVRHSEATEIVNWFREMFDPEPPPPPPSGGSGEDEQEDQDNQDENEGQGGGQGDQDANQDQGKNQGGQGDDGDGDGDGNGQPAKPDMSEANKKFDQELTAVSGQVENETGDSQAVQAVYGQPSNGNNTPSEGECGLEIGAEMPCNGWGDEVEPATITVQKVAIGYVDRYEAIKAEVRVGTRALVNKLAWTAQLPTMTEHGYRSGDLDEGSLSNLFLNDQNPAVFQRTEITARPDVAVGIMVDESGSMYGEKIEAARRVTVMLTEAFSQVAGTRVRVWGHTTGYYRDDECVVIPYVTAQHKSPHGISTMEARSGNIDGAALWYAAQELAKFDADAERRILFCISDGLPSGGQEDGVEYNRRKAEASRNIGVEVFGIGILNAYTPHVGERLFGKDAFCVFSDVESAGQVIGAFITRVVNRL
jgi:uncharacterized protein YegL